MTFGNMRQYNYLTTNIGHTLTWELDEHGIAHFSNGSKLRYIGTDETISASYDNFTKFLETNFANMEDKQPNPTTSGHYTVADSENSAFWIPSYYDAVSDKWVQYSYSQQDYFVIDRPNRWIPCPPAFPTPTK